MECKRLGRLEGPKGEEELNDAESQLKSYIRAHVDKLSVKPKILLGVVTDGNRWLLMGINKINEFHEIERWAFLTDDPRLIAQRLWLLAKPALAQPISALVEFLARRTLAEVLKDQTKRLTKQVNENLPDGNVSEELIGRWLREALSDTVVHRLVPAEPPATASNPQAATVPALELVRAEDKDDLAPAIGAPPERFGLRRKFWEGLLGRPTVKATRHANVSASESGWINAGSGVRGLPFSYVIGQEEGRVELWIDRGAGKAAENKEIFDGMHKHKAEIEKAFGAELSWQRLDDKQGCRIAFATTGGGYRSPEAKWPEIQDAMIDAMNRLEKALAPHLAKL